jgi:hypothetical protein
MAKIFQIETLNIMIKFTYILKYSKKTRAVKLYTWGPLNARHIYKNKYKSTWPHVLI